MAKILHVVEAFGGGVVTVLQYLTKQQCESGNQVWLAYGLRNETPEDYKNVFDERVQWIRVNNFQRGVGLKDFKALWELHGIYHRIQPDVIHCHSSKAGILCRVGKMFSSNVFYTPHGYSYLMRNASKNKRRFYHTIEYLTAHLSRGTTIACGKFEYEEAVKLGGKAAFVPNGVDVEQIAQLASLNSQRNGRRLRIGVLARIYPQKNPIFFDKVAQLVPDADFFWIGDGFDRCLLKAKNISVTGWMSHYDGLKKLAEMDVFLLPSLWEGLSISLLEAMALKRLCIVSDIPMMREVICDGVNGFLISTPEQGAKIIQDVIENKVDYDKITSSAQDGVRRNFNVSDAGQKYADIYFGRN